VVFRELLHNAFDLVTEDTLMDRIFCVFDRTGCGSVRLEDWLCSLSVFLRGTMQERTTFCFHVYDLNGDGYITRDEMFSLLKWVDTLLTELPRHYVFRDSTHTINQSGDKFRLIASHHQALSLQELSIKL
jgi:Ca2+-binding EF-hand superfamily protein